MKNQKRTLYLLISAIVVIASLVFLWTLVNVTMYSPGSDTSSTITSTLSIASTTASTTPLKAIILPKNVRIGIATDPVRLNIPTLNINAAVDEVGITAKGAMGTPHNFVDVAWYAAGTTPGDKGSAIIDGHVDNGLALAGVFKHLVDITVGDNVYVTRRDGTQLHFIVTDMQSYDHLNAPADMIFNQSDGIFLKLITCAGTWIPGDRTYDRRIVVTAVLAKE